jgi:3-oxoacyl-[acyl-carrier-protein] synthase II
VSEDLVITGLGLVLPCGDGVEAARGSLAQGGPCFADLPEALGRGRGAACAPFSPAGIIPPMQLRRLDRCSRFAWVAAHQAFQDAGLAPAAVGERVAVAVGTMTGGSEAGEAFMRPYLRRGPEGASPMLFPNTVANAASGHLALAFGLKGPSATFVDRENATFSALQQARRWLRMDLADAVLVLGVDGLFPLLLEACAGARLLDRQGRPALGSGRGFLPGEGAQAFLLEARRRAEARGAGVRATLRELCSRSATTPAGRAEALLGAVSALGPCAPDHRVGGGNGLPRLDEVEMALAARHPAWPRAQHPKTLWGEFAGAGGALLAAALLEPHGQSLVTAPASSGAQFAALLEGVSLKAS